MKKFRNAILSVFFALCCVFAISSTNLLCVKAETIEGENQVEENTNEGQENQEEVPPVEETPTYTDEEIEQVLNEAKDWIIALIVSFLGSGGFMAIAKAIINKWFSKKQKELELKVEQLEQDKVIATTQKDLIVSQFAELKQQFNEVLEHNIILCDYIKTKIEVDEEKEKRVNKLLEELLPKQEEGATDEK